MQFLRQRPLRLPKDGVGTSSTFSHTQQHYPPKNRCLWFSLGIFTCLSAETRTVSSSFDRELCVARLGVEIHVSTVPSNPTSRYIRRDDGQRGARVIPLGHQSNRNAPLTGSTRCLYCAYLSIDFLSTICPIDRPKVFLVSLHVLRVLLRNTFAYFVVRLGLLFGRPEKYERSLSLSYHDLLTR